MSEHVLCLMTTLYNPCSQVDQSRALVDQMFTTLLMTTDKLWLVVGFEVDDIDLVDCKGLLLFGL